MNNTLKSLFLILLISFSSASLFSQNDTTKTNNEINTTKGNYQLKAASSETKVQPISDFNLKIENKLNTDAINK
ncbi:MAG: hypothetical protein HQ490_07995, partial [Lutibacter sp.]|nr:hypothetical protein [Lutibacter sp.]